MRTTQPDGTSFHAYMSRAIQITPQWRCHYNFHLHWCAEHYADDLEVLLDQAMDEDFSVQLEDGSAILVAKQLVRRCTCW